MDKWEITGAVMIAIVLVIGTIMALVGIIDSHNKDANFVASLRYIEFDGHQYVTCEGWKDCRVLTHSPKCKCKEDTYGE